MPKATVILLSSAFAMVMIGAIALASNTASATPGGACLSREMGADEQELLTLHRTWRDQYIPGSDPSNPLEESAPLRAAALGIANDLATGAITPADVTPEFLAARVVLCGYPQHLVQGGRGLATQQGLDAVGALTAMTAETWGGGIRVPAYINGFPMRCVAAAHVEGGGGGEAWVILIFAGAGGCPQDVSDQVQAFGAPTATPTWPFPIKPTRTPTPAPTATPTATPAPEFFRLYTDVARD